VEEGVGSRNTVSFLGVHNYGSRALKKFMWSFDWGEDVLGSKWKRKGNLEDFYALGILGVTGRAPEFRSWKSKD
jgi:hypothetical protein